MKGSHQPPWNREAISVTLVVLIIPEHATSCGFIPLLHHTHLMLHVTVASQGSQIQGD